MKRSAILSIMFAAVLILFVVGIALAYTANRSQTTSEYPEAVKAAIQQLADQLGIEPGKIQVVTVEENEWPDACLGIVRIDALCAQVVTPGYRVVLSADGSRYEFHTNQDGSEVVLKPEERAGEVDSIKQAVSAWLADTFGYQDGEFEIVQVVQVEWPDGCLGVWFPGVSCTEALVPGYLVTIESEGGQFELHTNLSGSQIEPATVLLNWHREGGIAGFNDDLLVFAPGLVYGSNKTGSAGPTLLADLAGVEEMAAWDRWLTQYGFVEIVLEDAAQADGMTTTLSFVGSGTQQPTEEQRQELVQFAQTLFTRLHQ